jgi:hypothetical protein
MGKKEAVIAVSEQLPEGTEFGCILRVRKGSAITENALRKLLDLGKNQGLGANRGSGNMGAYRFKLEKLINYEEKAPKGFEGWD